MVDSASNLAKKFHISELVIGLTIVAVGTSMPELMISVTSSITGYSDIAIGNVIGSNITNLLLILGLSAVLQPLIFQKQTKQVENPFMLACTFLLWFLANNGGYQITRIEGFILLSLCAGFIGYQILLAKKENHENQVIPLWEEEKKISTVQSLLWILLGIVALKIGADWVVEGTEAIARFFGISERLISLTIVAFSTSLPELVTSISAARKGNSDIAIGNIIGSQIFNILLILGAAATIRPLDYAVKYNDDLTYLLFTTAIFVALPYIGKKDQMGKISGFLFLGLYAIYLFFTVCI